MWWNAAKAKERNAAAQKFGEEAFALTCLAIELAKSDDDYASSEMARLQADLAHHFDLSGAEVEELMLAAEAHQAQSVETYSYTRVLRDNLNEQERVVVVETLWRLAYADGVLDAQEFAFMRSIPSALGLENHICEAAKRRALQALGLPSETGASKGADLL